MKRIVPALILVGFIGAALLLQLTEPSDDELQGPFVTYAQLGEPVEGRDLVWTAEDAYLADRLTTADWIGETDGVWLIVEGTIGSRLGITSPVASVRIGDKRYSASDRPGDAALGGSLAAGLPQAGAFAFELPRSVLDSEEGKNAVARFGTGYDIRLDSAIDTVLDLSTLEHRSSVALPQVGVVTS